MKSLKHYLLIIAISTIPFITIFISADLPHTHDGPVQLARIGAYYKALGSGQILPRWASDLNYGYGMPLFNFMYHTPYLLGSLFVFLGAGLVLSFKLTLLFSYLLSGIGIFALTRYLTKDIKIAYLVTILYQFAPFHLVDTVVRGSIGEIYTYSFLPFVLLAIQSSFSTRKKIYSLTLIMISTALLIISHNSVSLLFFGIAMLYALVLAPTKNHRILAVVGLGLGILLSAFYWMPALFERRYTYGDLFMKDMYKTHFVPWLYFFIPNITDAKSLQVGGVAVGIGIVQSFILFSSLYYLIRGAFKKFDKHLVVFLIGITIISLIFMLKETAVIWEKVALLRMFQFPWRLLSIVVFASACLAIPWAGAVKKIKTFWVVILCVISVAGSAIYFYPPWGFDRVKESDYWNYPLNTTYFGETDSIWAAGPAGSYPKKRFEIIDGQGQILNPIKKPTKHTFTVVAETPVRIVDRTQYFPGWRVYANEQKIPVEFQDINWRGLITFTLPQGVHDVTVTFRESPIRQLAETISLVTLFCISFLFLVPRKVSKHS